MDRTTTGPVKRLLISGASGYIGRRLVHAATARGFDVVAAVRDPRSIAPSVRVRARVFDLTRDDDLAPLLSGIDGVIHLAAILSGDGRPDGPGEDLNVRGTRRLIEAARRVGVRRFVFLSSQSASADSPTGYGRSKWEIEQLLTGAGECSVRTGLVSGGPPRALYGVLFRLAKRLAVIPIVRPGAPVYPLHVDDLCAGLLSLVEDDAEPPRLVRIAAATSLPFGAYVRKLAQHRLGRRVRLLPIPARLILVLSRLTELVPFLPTISSERVRGLLALRPMDSGTIPAAPAAPPLGDVFGTLAAEGRRRRLLAEGATLMRYVLGARAPQGAWRRYVCAVLAEDDRAPIDLPGPVRAWPPLLRAAETFVPPENDRLRHRLSLATRIVEMTPAAAPVFHNYRERSRLVAWLALVWLVAEEALLLPCRWIATRLRNRRGRSADPGGLDY